MTLLILCLQFMKTGLFAIGGGLATIPFLYEMSDRFGWFSHEDIANIIAIAESTPGPIGVNAATYAGYTVSGWYGGILATLSLVFPSVVVILIVARVLDKFRSNRFVVYGFHILRPASTALIAAAGFGVCLIVFFNIENITFDMLGDIGDILKNINWTAIALCAVFYILMKIFKKIHPLFFILGSALVGIIFRL